MIAPVRRGPHRPETIFVPADAIYDMAMRQFRCCYLSTEKSRHVFLVGRQDGFAMPLTIDVRLYGPDGFPVDAQASEVIVNAFRSLMLSFEEMEQRGEIPPT